MKTLRWYLAKEIFWTTALVMAALLLLFSFFDLVDQIKDLGRGSFQFQQLLLQVLLQMPMHIYELFPIGAMIGTLFAMAQWVAQSEYTVMRTSGVSVTRLVWALSSVGVVFAVMTFIFGEYLGPIADQTAQQLKSRAISGIVAQEFRSGLWIKDGASFINVRQASSEGVLSDIRIYEFDQEAKLKTTSVAETANYQGSHDWILHEVKQTQFIDGQAKNQIWKTKTWHSSLEPSLLSVLFVPPDKMSMTNLYAYVGHLYDNRQKSLRYEIALWSKATYPLAVLVMMLLAVPFANFQIRQGGVGAKLFTGIMLGLAFYFLRSLSAYIGLLDEWYPFVSALLPMLSFLALGLILTWWQERR